MKQRCVQWSGRFLGLLICRDPSVCKFNRLHVDILRFSFNKSGYSLKIPLKRWVIFLHSWTSTGFSSNSTGLSVTNCRFSPIIAHLFRGIYRLYPDLLKENRRMSTCNRLDLQTLGSPPIYMPKISLSLVMCADLIA